MEGDKRRTALKNEMRYALGGRDERAWRLFLEDENAKPAAPPKQKIATNYTPTSATPLLRQHTGKSLRELKPPTPRDTNPANKTTVVQGNLRQRYFNRARSASAAGRPGDAAASNKQVSFGAKQKV